MCIGKQTFLWPFPFIANEYGVLHYSSAPNGSYQEQLGINRLAGGFPRSLSSREIDPAAAAFFPWLFLDDSFLFPHAGDTGLCDREPLRRLL